MKKQPTKDMQNKKDIYLIYIQKRKINLNLDDLIKIRKFIEEQKKYKKDKPKITYYF